ncbi:MAG: alpha/beta hydrolase [Gammaproteobacteria bacterium]|nr:alpha/beta hydrolase [Gammaproteobacteria bacterium]|tara:strand:+ start:962 stop:1462 length:501 start_codon:yes stop_codon:yes gene_type:complete
MTMVIFSHGQESGPWGTKIRAMSEIVKHCDYNFNSIDYQGISEPADRVKKLIHECSNINESIILVGSSMGGHVSTAAAQTVNAKGLFVLAPAYFMEGYEDLTPPPPKIPICIIHGWNDDVVPVENSIRYAKECSAMLHLINGDHRLTDNIDQINVILRDFLLSFTQ